MEYMGLVGFIFRKKMNLAVVFILKRICYIIISLYGTSECLKYNGELIVLSTIIQGKYGTQKK